MKIIEITNTWSLESGDDYYYDIGDKINSKILLDCEKLNIKDDTNEFFIEAISNTKYRTTGKVIFKDEYLLIIESTIRFGIVLNNEFRFGNHNYVGNKSIDHSDINIGDLIEAFGSFNLARMDFCIFTYLQNENILPDTGYEWEVLNIYKIDTDDWDFVSLSKFEKVDQIETSSQSIEDTYAIEFRLVDTSPKPFEVVSTFNGHINSICWLDPRNWIINCVGRIVDGVKKGEWYYFDKTGNHKKIFEYDE